MSGAVKTRRRSLVGRRGGRGAVGGPQGSFLKEFAAFALEKMADGVFLIGRDATIVYVNPAACRQHGFTREELTGQNVRVVSPDVTADLWEKLWGVTSQEHFQLIEDEHMTKDGRRFPVEVLANFFEIDGKEYSCSFTRDITNRREMERRIRQSEKMEAIGQLAGGIAHDFNNQLNGIIGYAEILKQELSDHPQMAKDAESIILAAQRSASLTAKLLAFSRQGMYLSVPIDLQEIVDETVQILERSLDKNIRIRTRYEAPMAMTLGDPSQIQNALLNLGINARDAMPQGGELIFSTALVTLDETCPALSTFEVAPGPYIRIRVVDSGVGISPDMLQRVFEPFFTTKAQGKGTGLGLASVYGAMKIHRGAAEITSREGHGTEVSLYLPRADVEKPEKERRKPLATRLSAKILLVDDEPFVREAMKRTMELLGCSVTVAATGREAVRIYRKSPRAFDVVVLDLVMPEMGGKETFIRMRKINPDLVAVVASGYSADEEVREVLDLGARAYIHKPFNSRDLSELLSELVTG